MATQEYVCDVNSLKEPFRTLISAAILAPSGDNTQPWKFEIDEQASTITVCLDPTRDTSPMNAGQHMARIACGAAVENIVQTAEFNGWATSVSYFQEPKRLAVLHVDGNIETTTRIEPALKLRCTNRKQYDGRILAMHEIDQIAQSCEIEPGISLKFISDAKSLEEWGSAIGESDAAMFGDRRFLCAFLENVRFDLNRLAEAEIGLPVGTLALTWFEERVLPWLGRISRMSIGRVLLRRSFASKAEQMVGSSAGLCVISAAGDCDVSKTVLIGRLMERAWLDLTRRGYAVQPMMSAPVLGNFNRYLNIGAIQPIDGVMKSCDVPNPICRTALAILRFGFAEAVTARTGRSNRCVVRVADPDKTDNTPQEWSNSYAASI